MAPVRAALLGDDPLARGGVAALLAGRDDVALVEGAPSDAAGLAALGVDAVLADAGATAPEVLRDVAAALPLVALADGEAQAARALAAGARGVIARDADADRIAAALTAAQRGLLALDGALAAWVRPPPPPAAGPEALTPREAEVLALLAEGLSNRAVAQRLGVSERTARFHVESILGKLGAESRSEAIVLAARRGLVAL